ncbi:sigma-70 family RNA polymerase sigma factor [Actinoplanes sp. NPDC049599]|uniref:sigma-70 family RNA polymerase sigma factor n=1 Tax=Actinoplanes sp. NPDC049599 TaxID=3363903 RepID=UPI0037BDAE8B
MTDVRALPVENDVRLHAALVAGSEEAQERARTAAGQAVPHQVEEDVLAAAAARQVRQAVADLPAAHRQAILLAYYDGLTYREVAQALDIPEGTAKWRLRTALHRIGERLRAEGFDDAGPVALADRGPAPPLV